MSDVVFLKGKKTLLRPVMKSDLPNVVRWINDPEVRHFIANNFPVSEQEEEDWILSLGKKKPGDLVFIIQTKEGLPIGVMGAHSINWVNGTVTTGAFIGEKEYWGRGFGSDAKMALLNYLFNTLNLRKVCSHVIAYNERSRRYSLRCGYKEEGILRKHTFRDGEYWDILVLAVFKEDFIPLWTEYKQGL